MNYIVYTLTLIKRIIIIIMCMPTTSIQHCSTCARNARARYLYLCLCTLVRIIWCMVCVRPHKPYIIRAILSSAIV